MKETTQVTNILFDKHLAKLSLSELKVILVVIRQTIGWVNKHTGKSKVRDRIICRQFMKKTGLSRRAVSRALQSLTERKMIRVTDSKGKVLLDQGLRQGRLYMYYSAQISRPEKKYQRSFKVMRIGDLL